MKKIIAVVLFLGVLVSLAFAASINESLTGGYVFDGDGMMQLDLLGQPILATSNISFTLEGIGKYNTVMMSPFTASTGNITTANISYRQVQRGGAAVSTNTLTAGAALSINTAPASRLVLTIYNYKTVTANVTGSILVR